MGGAPLKDLNRAAARQLGSSPSANVKRRQRQAAHEQITECEMDHYLQLYQSGARSP
jgi:hypothetical protein